MVLWQYKYVFFTFEDHSLLQLSVLFKNVRITKQIKIQKSR